MVVLGYIVSCKNTCCMFFFEWQAYGKHKTWAFLNYQARLNQLSSEAEPLIKRASFSEIKRASLLQFPEAMGILSERWQRKKETIDQATVWERNLKA